MKKSVKAYYVFLCFVLGIKIIGTIFSNGLAVHHGKKIAQLELQKQNLQLQQLKLNQELSEKSALSYIASNYGLSEFEPITQPILIQTSTTVASN